jgi:hypothetical protein
LEPLKPFDKILGIIQLNTHFLFKKRYADYNDPGQALDFLQ